MYNKARLLLAQVLAAVALSIVLQTWATIIYHALYVGELPELPLWQILLTAVVALAVARVSTRWLGWLRRLLILSVALGAAIYVPTFFNQTSADMTVFAFFIFASGIIVPAIADPQWNYGEARRWLAVLGGFFAVALLIAPFVAHLPVLHSLFGFVAAYVLALGLAWDHEVESITRQTPELTRTIMLLCAAFVLLAATVLTGAGAFSLRPLLGYVAWFARELLILLLFPIGFIVHALVIVFRFLYRLLAGREPEVDMETVDEAAEALREIDDVNPWAFQVLGVIAGLVALWLIYQWIRRGQQREVSTDDDERESLVMQFSLSKLLRSPRKWRKQTRLPREPQDIWQVFAFLEHWGQAKERPRQSAETVAEYERALRSRLPAGEVTTIARAFEGARYGEQALTALQWQQAFAAWRKIKETVEDRR